jgi:quinolinate synthase
VCILGHHYQRDEVIQFADHRGDSLKLSQIAAAQDDARYIVFCGVHFMAESAAVLSKPGQIVCLPNLRAGCAMAEMADDAALETALTELSDWTEDTILPITYVNSTAATKAVTGRAGGACCTSSNVRNVFAWALSADGGGAGKLLASPDQHLARNTAVTMGYDPSDCVLYDPQFPHGGLDPEAFGAARFILWKGYCHVHQVFRPEHIDTARQRWPECRILVHPECPREVVTGADAAGSTSQIIQAVQAAPAGQTLVIGTEGNLVRRLADENPDKHIYLLTEGSPFCWQMAMIDLRHLLWVLDSIADGEPVNQITVPEDVAAPARDALQRMIDIKAVPDVHSKTS